MVIRLLGKNDFADWLRLREQLWPECSRADHHSEMMTWIQDPEKFPVYGAFIEKALVGFLEASVGQHILVPEVSPVFYIEGLFVASEFRRRGIARKLISAAEDAVRVAGYSEIYSDTEAMNDTSMTVHRKAGFIEVRHTQSEVILRKNVL